MTRFPFRSLDRHLVALVVAALVAPFAAAHHSVGACDSDGHIALGTLEVGPGMSDGTLTFYVDDRAFVGGNNVWIYQETNGVYGTDLDGDGDVDPHDNLQRGGHVRNSDGWWDPCVDRGPWTSDGLVF